MVFKRALRDSYFGPFLQHGGLIGNSDIALPPHTNWKNLKAGRERVYRYVWFGHSSAQNDDVSATLCPKGWVVPLIAQGLGWVDLPERLLNIELINVSRKSST